MDLEILLKDPDAAREWVKGFNWDMLRAPDYVVVGIDEKIYLKDMDDEEAVTAAHLILQDIEIPRAIRELAYERHTH